MLAGFAPRKVEHDQALLRLLGSGHFSQADRCPAFCIGALTPGGSLIQESMALRSIWTVRPVQLLREPQNEHGDAGTPNHRTGDTQHEKV